jgi:hypothetical protein
MVDAAPRRNAVKTTTIARVRVARATARRRSAVIVVTAELAKRRDGDQERSKKRAPAAVRVAKTETAIAFVTTPMTMLRPRILIRKRTAASTGGIEREEIGGAGVARRRRRRRTEERTRRKGSATKEAGMSGRSGDGIVMRMTMIAKGADAATTAPF